MNKSFLFKEPDDFAFDENGVGLIVSGGNKATVDLFNKIAEVEFEGEIFKLKNVDFNIQIERPNISEDFVCKILTPEELIVKVPDVIISGDLIKKS